METLRILSFRVIEKGQHAFVVWPWPTPEAFLYEAQEWGCTYQLRVPYSLNTKQWIELVPWEGSFHGEYHKNLFFGQYSPTEEWGLYRVDNARSSHYITQHGLDGIPRGLWELAYEYQPGRPQGQVSFQFRIETAKRGAFNMTFWDWQKHFVSGRNVHISEMAIAMVKKGGK